MSRLMSNTSHTPQGKTLKRRAIYVLVIVALLVVGGVAAAEYVYGLGGPVGGYGSLCAAEPCSNLPYATFASCSIQNGSCEITMRNQESFSVEAVGCLFQHVYAIQGNGQTVTSYQTVTNNHTLTMTTVDTGTGVLSTQPKGLPSTTTIAVNSSATVYCTPSASVPTPTVGSQAVGEVQFTNQSITVNWLEVWQE